MAEQFTLRIITPQRVFYEGAVQMVVFDSVDGEMGVLAGHIPLTTVLDSTIFYLRTEEGVPQRLAAVHGGFVEILPDQMTVLTEAAEWPEEIDAARAEAAKERAEHRIEEKDQNPELDMRRAELALRRSLVRLQVKQ